MHVYMYFENFFLFKLPSTLLLWSIYIKFLFHRFFFFSSQAKHSLLSTEYHIFSNRYTEY